VTAPVACLQSVVTWSVYLFHIRQSRVCIPDRRPVVQIELSFATVLSGKSLACDLELRHDHFLACVANGAAARGFVTNSCSLNNSCYIDFIALSVKCGCDVSGGCVHCHRNSVLTVRLDGGLNEVEREAWRAQNVDVIVG